jgi:hypothetical protein
MGVERPKDTHTSESGVTVYDSDLRFDFNSVEEMSKVARDILPTLIKKHAKL